MEAVKYDGKKGTVEGLEFEVFSRGGETNFLVNWGEENAKGIAYLVVGEDLEHEKAKLIKIYDKNFINGLRNSYLEKNGNI